jgi:hypothetical protein
MLLRGYQWLQNGTFVGTDASTYTPTSLVTGDIIACQLLAVGGAEIALSNNIRLDSMGRNRYHYPVRQPIALAQMPMLETRGGRPPGQVHGSRLHLTGCNHYSA